MDSGSGLGGVLRGTIFTFLQNILMIRQRFKIEEIDEKSNSGSERAHELRSNDFEDAYHDDQWNENDPKDHANEKGDHACGQAATSSFSLI